MTDGLKAIDGVKLVTEPLETIVKAIAGVEHVYSTTLDDRVTVTARFYVGTMRMMPFYVSTIKFAPM